MSVLDRIKFLTQLRQLSFMFTRKIHLLFKKKHKIQYHQATQKETFDLKTYHIQWPPVIPKYSNN